MPAASDGLEYAEALTEAPVGVDDHHDALDPYRRTLTVPDVGRAVGAGPSGMASPVE